MGRAVLKSVMLLLMAVTAGFAQSKTTQLRNIDQSTITRLQQNIPELMQKGKIPGLSIALIRDGKTYWVKSFGTLPPGMDKGATKKTKEKVKGQAAQS